MNITNTTLGHHIRIPQSSIPSGLNSLTFCLRPWSSGIAFPMSCPASNCRTPWSLTIPRSAPSVTWSEKSTEGKIHGNWTLKLLQMWARARISDLKGLVSFWCSTIKFLVIQYWSMTSFWRLPVETQNDLLQNKVDVKVSSQKNRTAFSGSGTALRPASLNVCS